MGIFRHISPTIAITFTFLAVNILNSSYFSSYSFDITKEQRFTLSKPTQDFLQKLERPMILTLYVSEGLESISPTLFQYHERVKDFIQQMARQNPQKLTVKFIKIPAYSDLEDDVIALGLAPIPFKSEQSLFLGVIAENDVDGVASLPILTPSREGMLEFDLVQLCDYLRFQKRKTLALYSTLPLASGDKSILDVMQTNQSKPLAIYDELKNQYDLMILSDDMRELQQKPDLVMFAHAKPLSETAEKRLQSYLTQGGRTLIAVDPLSELAVSYAGKNINPAQITSNIPKFLQQKGVTFDHQNIVLDKYLAKRLINPETGKTSDYMAWLQPTEHYIHPQEPFLRGLHLLSFGTVGSFDFNTKQSDLAFTPLVMSSKKADKASLATIMQNADMMTIEKNYKGQHSYILAAKIEGSFDSSSNPQKSQGSQGTAILVADSDFLDDRFWVTPLNGNDKLVAGGRSAVPYADNGVFLLNSLDYLAGDTHLLQLRSRKLADYPLIYLDDMKNNADIHFKAKQEILQQEINDLTQKMQHLRNPETGKMIASMQVTQEIKQFTHKLIAIRKELRHMKQQMNESLDALILKIKLLNILVFPLLIGFFPAFALWLRNLRQTRLSPVHERHFSFQDDV